VRSPASGDPLQYAPREIDKVLNKTIKLINTVFIVRKYGAIKYLTLRNSLLADRNDAETGLGSGHLYLNICAIDVKIDILDAQFMFVQLK
jgi:hypothetical protein